MNYFLYLKAALSHIEDNLQTNITAESVARETGFSASHFHAVFRTAIGVPPAAYIRTRRLLHAAKELAESKERVLDIALRYGFDSHETFTRAFGRQFRSTPSEFRMKHTSLALPMVQPGIQGPRLIFKEETMSTIQNGLERFDNGAVLHGVPQVSYFGNPPELTPYIACLKTAMHYIGVTDIPYAHYHCTAGSAFRLMWNTACWDGGNVDILVMAENPMEPLIRAIEAAGRDYRMLFKENINETHLKGRFRTSDKVQYGDKAAFLNLIKAQIDKGIPVIAFGVMGPPEACLVTGYREDGEALIGWNFFQGMPDMVGAVELTEEGTYVRRGWFEDREMIGVVAIGDCTGAKPLREQVTDALRYAVQVMSPHSVGTYTGGLSAFDAWAVALDKKSEFPDNAPVPFLFERLMCESDAHTMVAEGRSYAEGWLKHMAGQFPQASEPMRKAAGLFEKSHKTVWEMWDLIGGLQMGEKQARNLGNDEIRTKLVGYIHKLKAYDEQAIPLLQKAADLI